MARVEEKGRDYGLQMHWGKVCLVRVGSATQQLHTPQGEPIQAQDSMLYLGSTVHANGKFGCEISRKIGFVRAEFDFLHRIWKSSALPQSRKLQIFDALILCKLRYGVASSWLSKSELRRLDGFEAWCLRKMLGIKPSFISRVSNARVRQIAGTSPISSAIRTSQLRLLGQVLTEPCKSVLKDVAFQGGGSLTPTTAAYVRRVGRPKHNWTDQLMNMMRQAAGSLKEWNRIVNSFGAWMEVAARVSC